MSSHVNQGQDLAPQGGTCRLGPQSWAGAVGVPQWGYFSWGRRLGEARKICEGYDGSGGSPWGGGVSPEGIWKVLSVRPSGNWAESWRRQWGFLGLEGMKLFVSLKNGFNSLAEIFWGGLWGPLALWRPRRIYTILTASLLSPVVLQHSGRLRHFHFFFFKSRCIT